MDPPGDPGGTTPDVGVFVTITNAEAMSYGSSVDTDCSQTHVGSVNKTSRRKRTTGICRHCNKKRKRSHGDGKNHERECLCSSEIQVPSQPVPGPNSLACTEPCNTNVSVNTKPLNVQNVPLAPTSIPTQPNSVTPGNKVSSEPNNVTPQPLARPLYQPTDLAPYVVHVQRKTLSPDDNVSLHPISFGQFLKRNNFISIINGSLKRLGRNRVAISFTNHKEANDFIESDLLKSANYKAFIPSFSVTRIGIVRGVPSDLSEDEVRENISVPVGCGPILKVRRINRKISVNGTTEFKATESVILTFDGQVLPKRIFMCYTALSVDLYIYPTIQCFNCCRFGHVKTQCRSLPRCYKCGQGHSGDKCSVDDDDACCCLCKGNHIATSRKCLEYERQRAIKESMAKECISYAEASKQHAPISRISYADALLSSPGISSQPQVSSPQHSQSQNKYSPPTHSTSYKKTVFMKPRSTPNLNKGYDEMAHKAIIKDYDIPISSNGSALKNKDDRSIDNLSVTDLIIALIKLLTQSNFISPSNAAFNSDIISHIVNIVNNGQSNASNTVELL